jgi:glyceraldehyde-3-phosphate dehydrogenase/erythrose-4-phosphate dehydrogenase
MATVAINGLGRIGQAALTILIGSNAGLRLDHLCATAAHYASSYMLDNCHYDTWTVTERSSSAVVQSGGSQA